MSKTEMWGLEQSPVRREGSIHSGRDHMTSKVGVRVKKRWDVVGRACCLEPIRVRLSVPYRCL